MGEPAEWFTRHRDAFLDDVKDAWKLFERNISQDYTREKRSKNEEKRALSAEISSLIVRAARVDTLQEENETLRAQLAAALQAGRNSPRPSSASRDVPRSSPESTDTVATEPAAVPYKDYAELTKKYNDLKSDYDAYRVGYEAVLKKYQGSKKAVKEWQAYIDRCRAKGTVLKGSPAPLKIEELRAEEYGSPRVARLTSELFESSREPRHGNISPVSLAPSHVSSTPGGFAIIPEPGRITASSASTRSILADDDNRDLVPSQRPAASETTQARRSPSLLSNPYVEPLTSALDRVENRGVNTEQADASAMEDAPGTIPLLPPEVIAEMSQHREPVRSSHWLRACFEKDLVSEIPQSLIWNAYVDAFKSYSEQIPLMKMNNFMNHIPNVFPGASSLQVSQDDGVAYVVKGIKPRGLVQPQSSIASASAPQEMHDVSKMPSSSQTTGDATSGQEVENQNPVSTVHYDEDSPVVVSSRSLKRKQPSKPKGSVLVRQDTDAQNGTPAKPIRVKEEDFSSPVLPPGPSNPLTRTSTLDLDEFERLNDTPRKRRRLEEMMRRSQLGSFRHRALDSLIQERSTSMPPGVDDSLSDELDQNTRTSVPSLTRSSSDPIKREEDSGSLSDLGPHRDASNGSRTAKNQRARALRTLSPNTRILPRTSGLLGRTKRKEEGRGAKAVHAVAEDGEKPRKQKSPESVARSTGRLQSLLEAPTPVKQAISGAATPVPTKSTRTPDPQTAFRNTRSRTRALGATSDQDPDTIDPDHEPLRARPVTRLNLDDFKVNSAYNQGLDYAFVETVRNRDTRRCLPGCTRPECCGAAFRALVEAGANPTVSRGLWDSSQDSVDDEERLLADYLGTSYSRASVAAMSEEERKELVIQARTRLMADRHGRHRNAYERRATPPGFWRSDMPTTQEIERDREEVRQLERRRVEERWREAMREGGRWIFRDE